MASNMPLPPLIQEAGLGAALDTSARAYLFGRVARNSNHQSECKGGC